MRQFKFNAKPVAVAALLATALSSCNRGYGCPTNFSLDGALDAVAAAVWVLF